MKFTCDSCNAQYMISDDKVGTTGVKVRCKKCGHVITVRRADEAAATSAPAAAPPAPTPSGDGLDAELGNAFDSAFGDKPPPPAPDLDATQAMSPEDANRIAGAGAPAALSTEWYVAIGEAQVGPLPIADVKRKWEQGDVGPDSLVWRPGMGDWSPLSTVAELASVLSPIPRPATRAAAPPAARPGTPGLGLGTPAAAPAPASTPAPDATWKPAGASALAALASEEIQSRAAPAPVEAPKPAARPGGAKSLVEQMNLSEGGVEPTGALPLSIKGVERTDESPIRRKSSVAARQEEVRQKRGTARAVIATIVVVLAIVAAAGYFGKQYLDQKLPGGAVALLDKGAPPPAVAPPAPAPAPAAAPAPAPAPAPVAPPPPPVAAVEPTPAAAPPPAPAAAPAKPVKGAKGAKALPPPPLPAPRTAVARAEPVPPPPPPKPKGKSDSILDIDGGGDDALADALGGGGGSGRSVYVPPKPGGAAALPDQVSDGQITEGIKGKFETLAGCADKGSGSGATVVIQWDIGADGAVRGAKCKAPCGDPAIGSCLAGVVRTIRFPRSVTGRSRVEFPFKF